MPKIQWSHFLISWVNFLIRKKNVFESYNCRDLVVFYAYICYVLHGELGGVSYSQADGRAYQIGRRSSRCEFEIFKKLPD